MAGQVVSEKESERVIQLEKGIVSDILWKERDDYSYRFDVPVESEEQLPLKLIGSFNPRTGYFSFLLLYARFRVRALDFGKPHHNPGCENVGTKHKHKWRDGYHDKWAYEPEEVQKLDDLKKIFIEFLKECNITLKGKFFRPPKSYQEELFWP